jgi:choline dehydrogenase-like flavoprotein
LNTSLSDDLAQDAPNDVIRADICVIGAGPVGLTVARALAEKHHTVILLDRGPAHAIQQHTSKEIRFDRRVYRGATAGRAFGAGGTSAIWGGQLLPPRGTDLEERLQIDAPAWPVQFAELSPHFETLEGWLCVTRGSFALPFAQSNRHPLAELRWDEWTPRFSKWIPFGRRNIYRAFAPALAASKSAHIYWNAKVRDWHLQRDNGHQRVIGVTARSANGHELNVRARAYVVCAGALESARCVLEMNEAAGGLASGVEEFTGRFLHDHLSVRLARVHIVDHAGFQQLFAPIFVENTLRSLRMELSDDMLSSDHLPALYAHFVIEIASHSGFALLRELFRGIQHGKLGASLAAAWRLPLALPGIAEIMFERFVRRRLAFPRQADVFLHGDFEQAPLRENRVYLGTPDPDGDRPLHIDWDLGGDVRRIATVTQAALARLWRANGLERVARLELLDYPHGADMDPNNLHDIYHPAGTTRMSLDSNYGVVDSNLMVHGTINAFVAGSAVFPSMGASNPTFTAMALGLRLAAFIDHEWPSRDSTAVPCNLHTTPI